MFLAILPAVVFPDFSQKSPRNFPEFSRYLFVFFVEISSKTHSSLAETSKNSETFCLFLFFFFTLGGGWNNFGIRTHQTKITWLMNEFMVLNISVIRSIFQNLNLRKGGKKLATGWVKYAKERVKIRRKFTSKTRMASPNALKKFNFLADESDFHQSYSLSVLFPQFS